MKGIYEITNAVNGKRYIGSSTNVFRRWQEHLNMLINNSHHSHILQADWSKYELNDFTFRVLEYLPNANKGSLLSAEQLHIDGENMNDLYNVSSFVSYKDISMPTEFKENITYVNNVSDEIKNKLRNNIIIAERIGSIGRIGKRKHDLSKTWYIKNYSNLKTVKNKLLNYFQNITKAKSHENAWTTFTQYQRILSGKGYTKSFVPLNGKIDNLENKRNYLCFTVNCFPNSFLKTKYKNDNIEDDTYALSILVKWIVSVADIDKPIHIYIMSLRMEQLLKDWLGLPINDDTILIKKK